MSRVQVARGGEGERVVRQAQRVPGDGARVARHEALACGVKTQWCEAVACCTLVSVRCSMVYTCGVPIRHQWEGKGQTVGIHRVSICIMGPTRLRMTPSHERGRLRVELRIVPGCHSVYMLAMGSEYGPRGGCKMRPSGRDPKGGGGGAQLGGARPCCETSARYATNGQGMR